MLNRNFIIISSFSTLCYDVIFSTDFNKKNILLKIIFLTFGQKLSKFLKKTVGSEKLPLVNNKNIFQLSNFKNSDIEIDKILKKRITITKPTKKYFMNYHSEKFFFKTLSDII